MRFLLMMLFVGLTFLIASVDINNADKKQLMGLKGVGEVKAAAILEFRKNHCFKNISELSLVKGIGAKTIVKNDLSVGECK